MNNDNRDPKNSDMRALFDEIRRGNQECNDKFEKVSAHLVEMDKAHIQSSTKLDSLEKLVGDIKDTVIPIRSKIEVHSKDIEDTEKDVQKIYGMISEDRKDVRDRLSHAKSSFWNGPNAKYVFWSIFGVLALIALLTGVMTMSDVKDIAPLGGE